MANSKNKQHFKIDIVFDEHHQVVPITGALGSPHPTGEAVTMHLYSEYNTLPRSVTHDVSEGGVVNLREGKEDKDGNVIRIIKSTSIIPVGVARSIGQWLIQQADAAEERKARLGDLNESMQEESL